MVHDNIGTVTLETLVSTGDKANELLCCIADNQDF